jgi:hypothetical protein
MFTQVSKTKQTTNKEIAMRNRKNNQSFEALNNRAYELRAQIMKGKEELAEVLALLQQFSDIVTVEKRISKDELGVTPKFSTEWSI